MLVIQKEEKFNKEIGVLEKKVRDFGKESVNELNVNYIEKYYQCI